VPSVEEQEFIHNKLVTEIELGEFLDKTRQELLSVIDHMVKRDAIEAVILGCTELPLILNQKDSNLPFLITTGIHVSAICNYCVRAL
jgi:aspartate racemase